MSDTFTFISADGGFQITVFAKCATYGLKEYDYINLFQDMKIHQRSWLHNPRGPAIVNLKTGEEIYWFEGRPATDEEVNKIRAYRSVDISMKRLFDE